MLNVHAADPGSPLFAGRRGSLKKRQVPSLFEHYRDRAELPRTFISHYLRHSIATHLLIPVWRSNSCKTPLGTRHRLQTVACSWPPPEASIVAHPCSSSKDLLRVSTRTAEYLSHHAGHSTRIVPQDRRLPNRGITHKRSSRSGSGARLAHVIVERQVHLRAGAPCVLKEGASPCVLLPRCLGSALLFAVAMEKYWAVEPRWLGPSDLQSTSVTTLLGLPALGRLPLYQRRTNADSCNA
jgi:hypothetical protein